MNVSKEDWNQLIMPVICCLPNDMKKVEKEEEIVNCFINRIKEIIPKFKIFPFQENSQNELIKDLLNQIRETKLFNLLKNNSFFDDKKNLFYEEICCLIIFAFPPLNYITSITSHELQNSWGMMMIVDEKKQLLNQEILFLFNSFNAIGEFLCCVKKK